MSERTPSDLPDDGHNGHPSSAEIFRVFRTTMVSSIEGLRLLLAECADIRAELVTMDGKLNDEGFSSRQRERIAELNDAAHELVAVLNSLPS